MRRELTFTDGKVIVRGKLWKRGKKKRADYVLYWKKNLPLAVIEAKEKSPVCTSRNSRGGLVSSIRIGTRIFRSTASRASNRTQRLDTL